jgi:transposase
MLALSNKPRILLFQGVMDMRKGFESLGVIVESYFNVELTSGTYFVFLNRRRNRIKVLYWDNDGLAIWYKRLEKGRFPIESKASSILSRREFFMLLEGVIPKKINKRYQVS